MCKYSWVHKTYFDQTGLLLIRIIYAMEKKLKCRLYTVTTTRPVEMTENAGGLSVYLKFQPPWWANKEIFLIHIFKSSETA